MDLLAAWTRAYQAAAATSAPGGAGATGAAGAAGGTASSSAANVTRVGERLVAAYGGPERVYHDLRHLAEVLARLDELAGEADDPDLVRLAAWFHDAVYLTAPADAQGASEECSALLAERELGHLDLPSYACAEVARLVRLTSSHVPAPGDRNGAVLCDADLAVLARGPAGYAAYVADVRREYAAVPEPVFRTGRAAVLCALLEAPALFRTELGRLRWEAAARQNMLAELDSLQR